LFCSCVLLAVIKENAVPPVLASGDVPVMNALAILDGPGVVDPVPNFNSVNKLHFRELDDVEVKKALAGGERKSRHSEVWAANAFDEWRVCHGYSVEKSIADLSEESDIRGFIDLLFKITL
jgi:hypothetical protein